MYTAGRMNSAIPDKETLNALYRLWGFQVSPAAIEVDAMSVGCASICIIVSPCNCISLHHTLFTYELLRELHCGLQ